MHRNALHQHSGGVSAELFASSPCLYQRPFSYFSTAAEGVWESINSAEDSGCYRFPDAKFSTGV